MTGGDKFSAVAAEAEYAVSLFSDAELSRFEMVLLKPFSADFVWDCEDPTLQFLGVVGLVRGEPRVALRRELPEEAHRLAVQAVLDRVMRRYMN